MTVDNTVFDNTCLRKLQVIAGGVSEATNKKGCEGIMGRLFRGCCCFDSLMFNWSMQCVSHDDRYNHMILTYIFSLALEVGVGSLSSLLQSLQSKRN